MRTLSGIAALIKMDIALGIRNGNARFIKGQLDIPGQVKADAPVFPLLSHHGRTTKLTEESASSARAIVGAGSGRMRVSLRPQPLRALSVPA